MKRKGPREDENTRLHIRRKDGTRRETRTAHGTHGKPLTASLREVPRLNQARKTKDTGCRGKRIEICNSFVHERNIIDDETCVVGRAILPFSSRFFCRASRWKRFV